MLERKYSDFGMRCTMAFLSGRHLNLQDDSDMFTFLEFRFGCLSSPYQKYSDVCRSCSVYTFLFQWNVHSEPSRKI